jgi:hypothetical protein
MSKISETKALEAYPICNDMTDFQRQYERYDYLKGYDQAMKDIKEFIYDKFNIHPHDCHVVQYESDKPLEDLDDFVEQFETYLKDESEN